MDGPRAPHETEFPSVVQFLDKNLRPESDWSIQAEYPVAISQQNIGNIRIIKDHDEVLSHAVMRPLIIKSPIGLFKVAGIGSVVTSSEHRNRGLSRTIIENCLQAAQAHGCDFAILWTNLYDFYRKMGFELAGSEVSVVIEKELGIPTHGLRILETPKVAADAIHRLYTQHTVVSLRTLNETQQYLQIPNTRVYTAWDASGTLQAYAIEGKGADLNGYIHEWGGQVPALLALFAHIRKAQNRAVTAIIPAHSQNLLRQLKTHSVIVNDGFLGMVKILNHVNLYSKINRHARALGIQDLVLERRDGATLMGVGANIFKTDADADVIRLIFGPYKASQIHDFDPKTREALEKVLPVPMWIWGWDSI
ncbi:MAG: GNAT family N-acetyltransferase [Bdellovibrionaceae bacterium]|nr:GNAT family N-acetyltransferase [Pseudobdellovibrionaceae bacterium]